MFNDIYRIYSIKYTNDNTINERERCLIHIKIAQNNIPERIRANTLYKPKRIRNVPALTGTGKYMNKGIDWTTRDKSIECPYIAKEDMKSEI